MQAIRFIGAEPKKEVAAFWDGYFRCGGGGGV